MARGRNKNCISFSCRNLKIATGLLLGLVLVKQQISIQNFTARLEQLLKSDGEGRSQILLYGSNGSQSTAKSDVGTHLVVGNATVIKDKKGMHGNKRKTPNNKKESDLHSLKNENDHLVFIGDSSLKYAFLEYMDQEHHHSDHGNTTGTTRRKLTSSKLIHERNHPNLTSFFQYTTEYFDGRLSCDCQESEVENPWTGFENMHYFNPHNNNHFTYIKLNGDDIEARGRYRAQDMPNVTISTNEKLKIWSYSVEDLDKLILDYVAHLKPKPTAIIMNAGLGSTRKITNNMDAIINAAHEVSGGRVIWKGKVKDRTSAFATPSEADRAAKEFTYRLPGVVYQPFAVQGLTNDDYFDDYHFSNALVYRQWNTDLKRAIGLMKETKTPKEIVFMVSGAIRTLEHTHKSILRNWIWPLCPPPSCIAHIVTHFSFTDNRPNANSDDPKGSPSTLGGIELERADELFNDANAGWLHPNNKTFLVHHHVPGYDIGSEAESKAMDVMEEETGNLTVRSRLRMLRHGDPRRYSMWFARAWMWRFVKELEETTRSTAFDFYAFARPDLLWMVPSPTIQFFHYFHMTNTDAWVHDTNYEDVPDTFAYLPTNYAAEEYFSLERLVEPGMACLGGPNFNRSLVSMRFKELDIQTAETDWCGIPSHGWSERILGRKMRRNLNVRHLPAGNAIVRPVDETVCQPLHPKFFIGFVEHCPSYISYLQCLIVKYSVTNKLKDPFESASLFRLRDVRDEMNTVCLRRASNGTLIRHYCEQGPILFPAELFSYVHANESSTAHDEMKLIGFGNTTSPPVDIIIIEKGDIDMEHWRKEPIHLYSSHTLDRCAVKNQKHIG